MNATWTNWSGRITCAPQTIAAPKSESELIEIIRQASRNGSKVRVAGAGHSFVPLCATDGVMISLDQMQGVLSTDSQTMTATLWAETKIYQIGEPLLAAGMALENQGDIDRQAIAGAISTGTHGTGKGIGSLSTQVAGLRLILASGEVLECSREKEPAVFQAARVSLGLFGVISQITLRVLPAYRLHERTWVEGFDECMSHAPEYIGANRHFEFFWSPREDACAIKTLNPTTAEAVGSLAPMPQAQGRLTRYIKPERIDWSFRIFPSERNLRFNELEFSVPEATGPDCLREMRQLMLTKYPDVVWPLEYRTLGADDIYLSTAYQRDSIAISVHQATELPHEAFFADAEAIFCNHGGRPHWGKIHWRRASDLRKLYPMWEQFHAIRSRLDPAGCFMNEYLRLLCEESVG